MMPPALLAGYLFLEEKLSPLQLGGTGLVLGGISITTKHRT